MAYPYGQVPPGGYGTGQQYQAPGGYPQGQPGYGAPGQPAYGQHAGFVSQQPGMDPQIQQWFASVDRDRSGRITSLELQQALVNANWTQFNPETCRLMIGMFDKDRSGTIDISEFQALWHYIQQWRSIFERIDANRSGAIEAHELQTALSQMGYNLSPNFISMLTYRYDVRARRSLTLDNFIQVCVTLKSLTDSFKQRDTSMSGTININYEDFMTLAILN